MNSIHYTRSTLSDNLVVHNAESVINVVKKNDGKLFTPDNELIAMNPRNKIVVHSNTDIIDIDDSDKYFVEIAWHDRFQNAWFSAILIPETWEDVIKSQELCEGSVYNSLKTPQNVLILKELYALSWETDSHLVRYNVEDVKISLETGAENVYISRGINSGILMSHKYENMINKNELPDSFVWVSGWKLKNSTQDVVKSAKHHLNMYK